MVDAATVNMLITVGEQLVPIITNLVQQHGGTVHDTLVADRQVIDQDAAQLAQELAEVKEKLAQAQAQTQAPVVAPDAPRPTWSQTQPAAPSTAP